MAPGWRDRYGNTFDQIVSVVNTHLISADEQGRGWLFDDALFPPLAVKTAVENLQRVRKRPLIVKPISNMKDAAPGAQYIDSREAQ